MSIFDITVLVLLCAQSTYAATTLTATSTPIEQSTCPSRTVNYLTHTLAQQCLTSTRSGGLESTQVNNNTITIPVPANVIANTTSSTSIGEKSTALAATNSTQPAGLESTSRSPASSTSISIESVTTVTATRVSSGIPVPLLPPAVEEDSPLESGNFLSFEEWKKQNLIKAGQSVHIGTSERGRHGDPRKRPGNVQNTLDSLGDDAEIDLDFSGLVPGGPDSIPDLGSKQINQPLDDASQASSTPGIETRPRGKDAGTTSKERYNYASLDCAASVLKTNPEAKSPNSVLLENKDSYMLNKCSANNKFIVLELCNDISIDTIVLANFEFFSSSFRTFRVGVSDKYPVKADKWKTLGTFEARNTREVQAFLIENPIIWASYVKIEFLTHYGSEFYCPVSLIRVHGTTMLQDYKADLEMNMDEDDEESDDSTSVDDAEDKLTPEAVDPLLLVDHRQQAAPTEAKEYQAESIEQVPSLISGVCQSDACDSANVTYLSNGTSSNIFFVVHQTLLDRNPEICDFVDRTPPCVHQNGDETPINDNGKATTTTTSIQTIPTDAARSSSISSEGRQSNITPSIRADSQNNSKSSNKVTTSTGGIGHSTEPKKSSSTGPDVHKSSSTSREAARSSSTKHSGSGTQPQPATPTMQESFFKSVQKRIQMLESNSSLSLQYIEEQSRSLRDAFRKVEQRQLSKTSTFLEHLNATVLGELREFRQQYDHLWQSTVIELELQRERYEQESQAMHARLGLLADELIFQRRVSMLQMVLILVCLGLILFSRGAIHNYLELPLVQSVLSRSPSSKWATPSTDARTLTPAMKRTRSAHQLGSRQGILKGHNRGVSEDSNNEALSASEMYSPPTPVSFDGYSDAELVKVESKLGDDPEFDPMQIERPSTSPPTLFSTENPSTPRSGNHLDDISIDSRLLVTHSSEERFQAPLVKIEHPTPPHGRHLTWNLPNEETPSP